MQTTLEAFQPGVLRFVALKFDRKKGDLVSRFRFTEIKDALRFFRYLEAESSRDATHEIVLLGEAGRGDAVTTTHARYFSQQGTVDWPDAPST